MRRIEITGSKLLLPRLLNDAELGPEGSGPVSFDLGCAGVQAKDANTISLALWLAGKEETFACLFLDFPSAKALAEELLKASS